MFKPIAGSTMIDLKLSGKGQGAKPTRRHKFSSRALNKMKLANRTKTRTSTTQQLISMDTTQQLISMDDPHPDLTLSDDPVEGYSTIDVEHTYCKMSSTTEKSPESTPSPAGIKVITYPMLCPETGIFFANDPKDKVSRRNAFQILLRY